MIDAAVALIASNQDRNVSPVRPEYNEAGGMGYLCDLIAKQLSQRVKYVKVFRGPNESGDQTPLAGLKALLSGADAWLESQPTAEKYAISFHTDSGGSHTFGLYGSDGGDEAKWLATVVASACFDILDTDYLTVGSTVAGTDYTSYLFNTMIKAPSVLIEACSHVSAHDINTLWAVAQVLANEITDKLVTNFFVYDEDRTSMADELEEIARKINAIAARLCP